MPQDHTHSGSKPLVADSCVVAFPLLSFALRCIRKGPNPRGTLALFQFLNRLSPLFACAAIHPQRSN